MFQHSNGIHDFAVRTFSRAQSIAIDAGDERLTSERLREANELESQLSRYQLQRDSPDNQPTPREETKSTTRETSALVATDESEVINLKVDQIQHPEFAKRIQEFIDEGQVIPSDLDADLLRSLAHSTNLPEDLEASGCLEVDFSVGINDTPPG